MGVGLSNRVHTQGPSGDEWRERRLSKVLHVGVKNNQAEYICINAVTSLGPFVRAKVSSGCPLGSASEGKRHCERSQMAFWGYNPLLRGRNVES